MFAKKYFFIDLRLLLFFGSLSKAQNDRPARTIWQETREKM